MFRIQRKEGTLQVVPVEPFLPEAVQHPDATDQEIKQAPILSIANNETTATAAKDHTIEQVQNAIVKIGLNAEVVDEDEEIASFNSSQTLEQMKYDIEKVFSITPATFISRSFSYDVLEGLRNEITKVTSLVLSMEAKVLDFDARSDEERLENMRSSFGGRIEDGKCLAKVNALKELETEFRKQFSLFKTFLAELRALGSFIDECSELLLVYEDQYRHLEGIPVAHFGINNIMTLEQANLLAGIGHNDPLKGSEKTGQSGKTKEKDKSVIKQSFSLHPIEVLLVQEVIKRLDVEESKTVLIDIFVRDEKGNIIVMGNGSNTISEHPIEVHTVVLYKQIIAGKQQIIVIDPSDSDFSNYITTNDLRILGSDTNKMKFYPGEIYQSPDKNNVGPKPDQYRDCTDVAVKIAFGLNDVNKDPLPNKGSALLTPQETIVLQEISNQKFLKDLSGKDVVIPAVVRIKQASSDDLRHKMHNLIVKINGQVKSEETYDKQIEMLSNLYSPDQYVEGIIDLFNVYQSNEAIFTKDFIDLLGVGGSHEA